MAHEMKSLNKSCIAMVVLAALISTNTYAGSEPVDAVQMAGTQPVGVQYTPSVSGAVNNVLNRLNTTIGMNIDSINAVKGDVKKAQDTADKAQADATQAIADAAKAQTSAIDAQSAAVANSAAIANKANQATVDAVKATADKATADLAKTAKQVEDNRVDVATNGTLIYHLQKEAVVVNGQAQQLRNDLNVATKALSVLGGNLQQVQGQIGNFVTKPDFKTDQDRQDDVITDTKKIATDANDLAQQNYQAIKKKADLADLQAETQRATAAEQANTTAIGTKVDTQIFTTDQKRQDDALDAVKQDVTRNTQGVADNKTAIGTNTTSITTNATNITTNTTAIATNTQGVSDNKTAITTNTAAIATNTKDVADNKTAIAANTASIAVKVDDATFKADQQRQDALITNKADAAALKADEVRIAQNKTAIDTEVQTEQQHYQTLQTGVAQAQSTGAYAKSRADQAYANADANHQALVNTNQRLASDEQTLANHEQRITDLEKKDQVHFDKLEHQQNKDRKEFRSGIAGAMALTSIPQAPASDTVGFGMGVGTFNGENAMAAGVSARVSQHVSVKTGLSWDSSGNVGAGAGFLVSY